MHTHKHARACARALCCLHIWDLSVDDDAIYACTPHLSALLPFYLSGLVSSCLFLTAHWSDWRVKYTSTHTHTHNGWCLFIMSVFIADFEFRISWLMLKDDVVCKWNHWPPGYVLHVVAIFFHNYARNARYRSHFVPFWSIDGSIDRYEYNTNDDSCTMKFCFAIASLAIPVGRSFVRTFFGIIQTNI